jgi:hypothetical protein
MLDEPDCEVAAVETVGAREVVVPVVLVFSVAIDRIRAVDREGRGGRAVGRRDGGGGEVLVGDPTATGTRDLVEVEIWEGGGDIVGDGSCRSEESNVIGLTIPGNEGLDGRTGGDVDFGNSGELMIGRGGDGRDDVEIYVDGTFVLGPDTDTGILAGEVVISLDTGKFFGGESLRGVGEIERNGKSISGGLLGKGSLV